ncbi:unnamed protein product [Adineta ricciae]|nr:unnamed protein product [Adineta ricciae]
MFDTSSDGPLVIVLDNDDDEDLDLMLTPQSEQMNVPHETSTSECVKTKSELSIKCSAAKLHYLKCLDRSKEKIAKAKSIRRQRRRAEAKLRKKNTIEAQGGNCAYEFDCTTDLILSYVSFANIPNLLTISRIGCTYYCVEDLYLKVFSSLCILAEFTDLLVKPGICHLIPMTLSEKISIERLCSKLKEFNHTRYRLITINSTDYLDKLRELLSTEKKHDSIDQLIAEMRDFKSSATAIQKDTPPSCTKLQPVNDTVKSHEQSKDGIENQGCNEIQHEKSSPKCDDSFQTLFCATDEEVSTKTVSNVVLGTISMYTEITRKMSDNKGCSPKRSQNLVSSKYSLSQQEQLSPPHIENITFKEHSSDLSIPKQTQVSAHRYISSKEQSVTTQTNDIALLQNQSVTIAKTPMNTNYDNDSMPMIVSVEENIDTKKNNGFDTTPILFQNELLSESIYHSDSHIVRSTSQSQSRLSSYETSTYCNTPQNSPLARKFYYQDFAPSSQPPVHCSSSCTCQRTNKRSSLSEKVPLKSPSFMFFSPNETAPSRQHPIMACSDHESIKIISSSKQSTLPSHRKQQQQCRIQSNPYPPGNTIFAPLSATCRKSHRSHPIPIHYPSTMMTPPNTPNDPSLFTKPASGITLTEAFVQHGYCNTDELPKLVVRYEKIYSDQALTIMGQLFPTWFNQPDYRCVHCFTCDQVFTPQLFMTHIDDEQLVNKQPIDITAMQLLPSEKASKRKIDLWNQFCLSLNLFSKTGQINGFYTI